MIIALYFVISFCIILLYLSEGNVNWLMLKIRLYALWQYARQFADA